MVVLHILGLPMTIWLFILIPVITGVIQIVNYIKKTEDGEIYIERNSFIEPEIHEKLKRMPSGRKKLIVKRVPNDVPYEDYIKSGIIKYKNASNTWRTYLGVDVIALSIIRKIYYDYQETGEIPKVISCFK